MTHALLHLLTVWAVHHAPNVHAHWYQAWFASHIGNGCGAIHSGTWSC